MARLLRFQLILWAVLALAACSPKFDWREVRPKEGGYLVLLPAKPASLTRPIRLGAQTVDMTMTAADIDGVTFAVGVAALPDAAQAARAVDGIKSALINNIRGKLKQETSKTRPYPFLEIEALGPPGASGKGQNLLLLGRFFSRDRQVYQIIVVGPERALSREAAETFFSSFKPL